MFNLVSTLGLAAMVVSQAQAGLPLNCTRSTSVVSDNQTCNEISAEYNVSTYQLAISNPYINSACTNLFVGEILCLGYNGKDCNTTWVVQSGDICVGIADAFDIPPSTLYANNPNINQGCTNLYPGEVLCVSSTIYPYNATFS